MPRPWLPPLPPPINGGSDAGDVFINSSQSWQINNDYDLETVAIHEIGHSLGMAHSTIASAVMYAYYNGMTKRLSKLTDYPTNPNIALVSHMMCARTDEEARAKGDGASFFQFAIKFYSNADRRRPPPGHPEAAPPPARPAPIDEQDPLAVGTDGDMSDTLLQVGAHE